MLPPGMTIQSLQNLQAAVFKSDAKFLMTWDKSRSYWLRGGHDRKKFDFYKTCCFNSRVHSIRV